MRKAKNKSTNLNLIQDKIGTVGAVAIDKYGNIAAATSTGGMTNKMPGRVGDSPIIGSGTWAQNNVCGVSSTGHGEFFIKYQVAKEVCTRIEYLNKSIVEASQEIIDELEQIEAYGGIIAIDYDANIAMPFNTDGMIRGGITKKRDNTNAIFTGANTFTGALAIENGTLTVGGKGALGANNDNTYAGNISISADAKLHYTSTTAQRLTGTIALAFPLFLSLIHI